jgi:hypothetical protein
MEIWKNRGNVNTLRLQLVECILPYLTQCVMAPNRLVSFDRVDAVAGALIFFVALRKDFFVDSASVLIKSQGPKIQTKLSTVLQNLLNKVDLDKPDNRANRSLFISLIRQFVPIVKSIVSV